MDITGLVVFLAIGAAAGSLATHLLTGSGFGLVGNIVIGIIGAVIGGYIFDVLGIPAGGLIGSFVTSVGGATLLLSVVDIFKAYTLNHKGTDHNLTPNNP